MTLTSFEGRDYPPLIQRAMSRAMSPSVDLTPSERLALTTLLSRVEARDGMREFWVRRLNVAEAFGRVEKTISNWLASLEQKGWIEKEQGRTRWGSFQSLTLHLTKKAQLYLGLALESDLSTSYQKKNSLGIKNQGLRQSFRDSSMSAFRLRSAEDRVPEDCRILLTLQMTAQAVFRLMAMASKRGHRLAEVVKLRWRGIASSRTPYAYIATLLQQTLDYTTLAQRVDKDERATAAAHLASKHTLAAKRFCAGRQFMMGGGASRVVFNSDSIATSYVLAGTGVWRETGVVVGARLVELWLALFGSHRSEGTDTVE